MGGGAVGREVEVEGWRPVGVDGPSSSSEDSEASSQESATEAGLALAFGGDWDCWARERLEREESTAVESPERFRGVRKGMER